LLLCAILLAITGSIFGYTQADFDFIINKGQIITTEQSTNARVVENENYSGVISQTKAGLYSLLYVYQHFISSQTEPSCMFSPSCSQFTKLAIHKYGLMGVLMGSDRVLRCNGLGIVYYAKTGLNEYVDDPIEEYYYQDNLFK
jgi:putative component of membrane protein insertase Oxa1/YidC/SpoIIIJ protein YidD